MKKKPFAKKSLGQNFLIDQNYIDKIITALNPQKNETIVEIGAGRGALTKKLVERAGKVLAIEIDKDLTPVLLKEFDQQDNFFLIQQDALEINFQSLISLQSPSKQAKLVANLPYYISTAILQHLIQYRNSFTELILMLQKEVVERITAFPGNKERGYLTVLTEAYFETEKLFDVPPNAFRPVPKVTSSVMHLITRKGVGKDFDEIIFRELVSLGFRQKRKTIQNNLKNAQGELLDLFERRNGVANVLKKAQIYEKSRAETLSLDEWKSLCKYLIDE